MKTDPMISGPAPRRTTTKQKKTSHGVCHNPLKQPLKIGKTLNHQGTIPGSFSGWFYHVTVGAYGGPRPTAAVVFHPCVRRVFFIKNLAPLCASNVRFPIRTSKSMAERTSLETQLNKEVSGFETISVIYVQFKTVPCFQPSKGRNPRWAWGPLKKIT